MMTALTRDNRSHWRWAFLLALGIACLVFLPFVIYDKGYFIYYGDFNVQQIPFYQLTHRAVRNLELGWSWYTDLGANFIGSYSFYLLFSPFFWLTLPFPTEWLPHMMAPLLILKTACASLTAYLYLERFVRDRAWAVLGGLLYAFSGWMFFNIFFNHFHDVTVFFPLLLLGVELLVCEGRTGVLAIAVAINAIVNYWFFVGEVVFVVLYVFLRMTDPGWPMKARKFLKIIGESLLGVGLACAVLIPSVLAILGNPRTGADELLSGWNFWLYWHEQRQPAIIQSLFFPPELPARPNYLPDHGAKWASLSGWLPLFGMTGVLAYFFGRSKDWLKKILALSLLFALIPGLNSLFILLNHSYYARWFYMPVLLMALATIRALEDCPRYYGHFTRGLFWSVIIVTGFVVMSGLTPNKSDGEWQLGMYQYTRMFWAYAIGAVVLLALVSLLVLYLRHSPRLIAWCCTGVALVSVVFGIFYIANGKYSPERAETFITTAIRGRAHLSLPDDGEFSRIDVYEGPDNIAMFWGRPTIQAFHSIVPPSIMEFYPTVGVKRDVGSRPETDYPALRPLLSVKWLLINWTQAQDESPMPGYRKYAEDAGYYIYENLNYIPMGFGYDRYITRSQLEEVDTTFRSNMMLRAIVLEDQDAGRFDEVLDHADIEGPKSFTSEDMANDAMQRRDQAAYYFQRDRTGFTARVDTTRSTLLFFSVPYEDGWSAQVNGWPAEIVKANVGFMAVQVPAGDSEIRFTYRTPGLNLGLWISGASLVILVIILVASRKRSRMRRAQLKEEQALFATAPGRMSWEEYLNRYGNRRDRASRLQQALNEASYRRLPQMLEEGDRTLAFNPGEDAHTTDSDDGDGN